MSSTTPTPAQVPVAQELPPYSWRTLSPSAQLLYLQTANEANEAISLLNTDIVGFDLEWKPNFSKYQRENPVALVQIANNDYILLIHISQMRVFPERLKEYLQNPHVLKAGVGIQKDVEKLFRDHRVAMRGCVDLALLARSVDNTKWKGPYTHPIGLARLVQTYESFAMDKGRVRRSNWDKRLNSNQQLYAGNDAHAGFVIYTKLEGMKNNMATAPKTEYYTFDCFMGKFCHPSGASWAPHNPDYDPGPPPPPKIKKEKKSSESGPVDLAAQAVPSARSSSMDAPESAMEVNLVVQQNNAGSTMFPVLVNGSGRLPSSAAPEDLFPIPSIPLNPSSVAQGSSQKQAKAHWRRNRRGKRPQRGETADAEPQGGPQSGKHGRH